MEFTNGFITGFLFAIMMMAAVAANKER